MGEDWLTGSQSIESSISWPGPGDGDGRENRERSGDAARVADRVIRWEPRFSRGNGCRDGDMVAR